MLTKQNKLDIFGLLCDAFPKNVPIPVEKLSSYLEDNGLRFEEFGYQNVQALLQDLTEFLSLGNGQGKDTKSEAVYLHDYRPLETTRTMNKTNRKGQKAKTAPSPKKAKKEKPTPEPTTKKGVSPIPRAEKSIIQKAVLDAMGKNSQYKAGQEYPLSSFSKALIDSGVNCHQFGYGKMKNMLAILTDLFSIRDIDTKGAKQPVILILPNNKEDYPKVSKADVLPTAGKVVPVKEENKKTSHKKKTEKSEAKESDFFVPDKLLLSIKEMATLGLDDDTLVHKLKEDYGKAVESRTLERRKEGIVFPLSFVNRNGESLIGAIRKSDSNTSYGYYLGFVGPDKDKPKDYLRMMVHFNDFEESIQSLSKMAKKESWCYHNSKDKYIILKIYLQYTFYRLVTQKKILVDEKSGFVAFNTGLVTEDFDTIYGVMLINRSENVKEDYLFQGFTIAGSQGIGKIVVEHFSPLPKKATYIEDPSDLLPKEDMQIHTDYHHILLDNIDRLPLSFVSNICAPFADCKKIVDQIAKEKNDFKIDRLYQNLSEKIEKNDFLYNLFRASLEISINKGISMMHYDYRMLLPSFFPTRNVLSFMVPLSFGRNASKVEAVLLIEKTASGNYQGQTILTLKQCYVNSRLICPLESTYLKAEEIED